MYLLDVKILSGRICKNLFISILPNQTQWVVIPVFWSESRSRHIKPMEIAERRKPYSTQMKCRKEEVLKFFPMEVKAITSNTERKKTGMGEENIKPFPWVHYALQN